MSKTNLKTRPPIVTVMGHVDHGKTSLLSAIKDIDLTRKEFGGISQHIGAYVVNPKSQIPNSKPITFIDTPGHQAFTQMRARGAEVTDIVVLVVAADEGVKPQTKEAYDHARAAEVPIIAAINKIDLPSARGGSIEETKKQLVEIGLVPEELGGETVTVEVSAKTKKGLDHLLEMILLVAEMEELTADPEAPFEGVVIESEMDSRRGPVATVLVKEGTLRLGDEVFSDQTSGKVKAMVNDRGQRIKEAGPSVPVEILGLGEVAAVGSAISSEKIDVGAQRVAPAVETLHATSLREENGDRVLNIVLKSDVEGTLEAIRSAIQRLETSDQKTRFIHDATGDISESDVLLAQASEAIILGFNVKISNDIAHLAKTSGVDVRTYKVIYELLEDTEKALKGLLESREEKEVKAEGEIIKLFTLPKSGDVICGTRLDHGQISVKDKVNVLREGEVVHSGKVKSLSVESQDKKRVNAGVDVGILIKPQFGFKVKDTLAVP
jgi:translation initiation factor IF-2